MTSEGRIDELESVRGIAAALVVVFHVPKWNGFLIWPGVQNLWLMVDVFFVLSGFVIFKSYDHRLRTLPDLVRFQVRRFGRLYPVHFVFLVAFALLELAKQLAPAVPGAAPLAPSVNTPTAFLQNLLLVQAFVLGGQHTYNGLSWTISAEFYTYLLFAAVAVAGRRLVPIICAVLAACSLVALATGAAAGMENVFRCVTGFFVGCVVAILHGRYPSVQFPAWSPALALTALAVYLTVKSSGAANVWIYGLSASLISAIVWTSRSRTLDVLRSRPLVRMGELSYAIYMSHYFLITLVEIVLKRVLHKGAAVKADGGYIADLTIPETLLTYGLFVLALYALSTTIHEHLEKPWRAKSREWLRSDLLDHNPASSRL